MLALVGLYWSGLGLIAFIDDYRAASWARVPVTIEAAKWREVHHSRGGTEYRVETTYQYAYEGRPYTATRFSPARNAFRYNYRPLRQRYDELQEAQRTRQPVIAFVNPGNPAEAFLYRGVSDDDRMSVPAGFAVAVFASWPWLRVLIEGRADRAKRRRQLKFPGRPWRQEGLWPSLEASSGAVPRMAMVWIPASVILAGIGVLAPLMGKGSGSVPLVLFSGLCGVLFAFVVVRSRHLFRPMAVGLKYGRSRLLFTQVPLEPGGEYECVLLVKRLLVGHQPMRVTVRCVQSLVEWTEEKQERTNWTVYESTTMLDRESLDVLDTRIPLRVKIPSGYPDRSREESVARAWQLEVEAEEPGIDFKAVFELPVFSVNEPALIEHRALPMPA